MQKTRLQKFIAMAGIASRRKAEELIRQGKVEVNNVLVKEPWYPVGEDDCVKVNGKRVFPEKKKVYIMLNKPEKYVSTVRDQFSRKTVLDLVSGVKERIYPVGRLDYNTAGLLLLTNDGEFANKLMHPSNEIEKTYVAEIEGFLDSEKIKKFEEGIIIDNNFKTSPAKLRILKRKARTYIVEIKIHEGKNRQVKKMCEAIGCPVINLKRTAIGNLNIGELPEGQWRHLTREEVQMLMDL
ncbi:MAG: rRNA pseudouridine synthase [Clostridiaceae bacterium]|nr:rRNA pseudouridine synthase [Clostridiaceae bacterium]